MTEHFLGNNIRQTATATAVLTTHITSRLGCSQNTVKNTSNPHEQQTVPSSYVTANLKHKKTMTRCMSHSSCVME